MKLNNLVIIGVAATTVVSCAPQRQSMLRTNFILSVRVVWQKWNILLLPRNLRFGHLRRMKFA